MILLVFSSKNCVSLQESCLAKLNMLLVHEKINEMCEIQMKWITFVLFRTEKDHYEDTKKRQQDSDTTSPWKGKYRQLYWSMLSYYWSNIAPLLIWCDSSMFGNYCFDIW